MESSSGGSGDFGDEMVGPFPPGWFCFVDALRVRRRGALVPLQFARRTETQMFDESRNERCVIDQCDDVQWRARLGKYQRID